MLRDAETGKGPAVCGCGRSGHEVQAVTITRRDSGAIGVGGVRSIGGKGSDGDCGGGRSGGDSGVCGGGCGGGSGECIRVSICGECKCSEAGNNGEIGT